MIGHGGHGGQSTNPTSHLAFLHCLLIGSAHLLASKPIKHVCNFMQHVLCPALSSPSQLRLHGKYTARLEDINGKGRGDSLDFLLIRPSSIFHVCVYMVLWERCLPTMKCRG